MHDRAERWALLDHQCIVSGIDLFFLTGVKEGDVGSLSSMKVKLNYPTPLILSGL